MAKKKIRLPKRQPAPGKCPFCKDNTLPDYAKPDVLKRFLTERGKIISSTRSGVCALHQRRLSTAIKRARHLALLAFIVRE